MTGSFLREPPVSPRVQALYDEDLAGDGYIWNLPPAVGAPARDPQAAVRADVTGLHAERPAVGTVRREASRAGRRGDERWRCVQVCPLFVGHDVRLERWVPTAYQPCSAAWRRHRSYRRNRCSDFGSGE